MKRLLAPFIRPETYRALLYHLVGLALASLGLTVLIAGWTVTVVFAITPLVFPLLFGLRWIVGQFARAQALSANALLGTRVDPPIRTTRGASFWSRALNVVRDGAFWRQQVFLLVTWPLALIVLAFTYWAFLLLSLPVWYRWTDSDDVLGFADVHTFADALTFAAAGLGLLLIVVYAIGPYARLSRWLATRLLAGEPGPQRSAAETRLRRVIALAATGLVATCIVLASIAISELTNPHGYFWPVWPLLSLALVVGLFGWTVLVLERDDIARRTLGSPALAIQLGASALLEAFLIGVWAVTGAGYFWPLWPMLGMSFAVLVVLWRAFGPAPHAVAGAPEPPAGPAPM